MRVHLAMSVPDGWGGVGRPTDALREHGPKINLATWPPEKQREQAEGQAMVHGLTGPRVHLADRDPQHHGWASRGAGGDLRLRILLSFHYYRDTDLEALFAKYFTEPYPEVFLDSGAYSADTQGVPIDRAQYIAYIKRYRHLITTYSNLDVIRDPGATWANQQAMEDAGLAPLPVYHGGTDWSWLEHYIDRYPYIALGGLVGKVQRARGWIVRCFQLAQGRAVFHGFGVTTWQILKDLPWYSVDSSSWGQGFRFGQVPVFDHRKGVFHKIGLGDRRAWARHGDLVRSLGFDPGDFADRSRNDRAKICAISALSYMQAERWLRQRHGEIRIPERPDEPGLRVHLADTSNGINYRDADKGLKLHLAEGGGFDSPMADRGLKIHLSESYPGVSDTRQPAAYLAQQTEDTREKTND